MEEWFTAGFHAINWFLYTYLCAASQYDIDGQYRAQFNSENHSRIQQNGNEIDTQNVCNELAREWNLDAERFHFRAPRVSAVEMVKFWRASRIS